MADRILIATDLADGSDRTMSVGVRLAAALGQEVVALHVATNELLETLRTETPDDAHLTEEMLAKLRNEVEEKIARVSADAVSVDIQIAEGKHAGEVILQVLEEQEYSFGVIGVRSRSRVGKMLFGSTAQQVLLGGDTPIVAVPI